MNNLILDPKSTALILIDLQKGIVGASTAPHTAADVIRRSAGLVEKFRKSGAPIVHVNVDVAHFRKTIADETRPRQTPPLDACELVPEVGLNPKDIYITKRSWSAFPGTDLKAQLEMHRIKTIVFGGLMTNFGVESTAREAAGLGYDVVIVEDAMSAPSIEMHKFAMEKVFPRMARVRRAEEIRL